MCVLCGVLNLVISVGGLLVDLRLSRCVVLS